MNTNLIFSFLSRLQANNNKTWMDAHRKEYQAARRQFLTFADTVNDKLVARFPGYFDTPGRHGIERINNNLMFHPHRPTYKDHFGMVFDKRTKGTDFYFMLGLEKCMVGGGMWHPNAETLRSVREAIDYDGEKLQAIISSPAFKEKFPEMYAVNPLKTAPAGYTKDHEHINLLRLKNFAVIREVSREEVNAPDFADKLTDYYAVLEPLLRYLRRAVTV